MKITIIYESDKVEYDNVEEFDPRKESLSEYIDRVTKLLDEIKYQHGGH